MTLAKWSEFVRISSIKTLIPKSSLWFTEAQEWQWRLSLWLSAGWSDFRLQILQSYCNSKTQACKDDLQTINLRLKSYFKNPLASVSATPSWSGLAGLWLHTGVKINKRKPGHFQTAPPVYFLTTAPMFSRSSIWGSTANSCFHQLSLTTVVFFSPWLGHKLLGCCCATTAGRHHMDETC